MVICFDNDRVKWDIFFHNTHNIRKQTIYIGITNFRNFNIAVNHQVNYNWWYLPLNGCREYNVFIRN